MKLLLYLLGGGAVVVISLMGWLVYLVLSSLTSVTDIWPKR